MDDVIAARALHVLVVVIWIGGVSMATTVVLPSVRRGGLGPDRLRAFRAIEHRFAWQARTAIIVVGLTGFYMTWRLDLWDRFRTAAFWWMHAMVCLWLLFAFVLFVVIRSINKLKRKDEVASPPPKPTRQEELLTEIRDLLKKA